MLNFSVKTMIIYCRTSNIIGTIVGNKIVDHSDLIEASPVGTAPTTSSFSTQHPASKDWAKTTARRDKKHLSFRIWCNLYWKFESICIFSRLDMLRVYWNPSSWKTRSHLPKKSIALTTDDLTPCGS